MPSLVATPRKLIGIIIIALVLGPTTVMLWMGRWRAALLYVLASVCGIAVLFISSSYLTTTKLVPSDAITVSATLSVIGLAHALYIRSSALRRPWYSRWYVALPFPLVATLAPLFGVRMFFYQPFDMPSASMYPTLKVGDHFLVSKQSYKPERGDVAVFKLPTDTKIYYVKRIIGLPADRIQMRDGVLFINSDAARKVRREDFVESEGASGYHPIQQYEETLPNGVKYRILDELPGSAGAADNTVEYVVPAQHYFVLGDNRDHSQDSRYLSKVGYIPEENFVGPVVLRYWTRKGFGLESFPD